MKSKPYAQLLLGILLTLISASYCCQQPCVYVSNTTNILTVQATSLTNQQPVSIISNLSRAVALDVHVNRKLIFWSDIVEKNIKRANVDGSNIVTIVHGNRTTGVIEGLAVEWTTSLLYWTDNTYDKIEAAQLDGSRRKVLINESLDEPRGIAVDSQAGLMFWTDWGANPKIERAYLNGQNRKTIVSSSLWWPNDVALDHSTQKIYWVDAQTDKIETAEYSGANRRVLFTLIGIHPFGVAIYGSWLYWTDWNTASGLHKMNRTGGKLVNETHLQISGRKMGLAIYDRSRQANVSNGCQTNNGGCSFLCLLKPNGFTCECANGTILGNDGKSCSVPVVSCHPLTPPKFGSLIPSTCLNTGKYNDVCSFTCLNGFRIKGTTTRSCGSDGRWTGLNDTQCEELRPKRNSLFDAQSSKKNKKIQ